MNLPKTFHVSPKALAFILSILFVAGCTSWGPRHIRQDRFNYNEAISDSWKTQTLQNIVKLRYSDWPLFLNVEQVITQYTWEHIVAGKMIWKVPLSGDNDQAELGGTGKYSERPTVLYKPVSGDKYMKSMLTPSEPSAILALIQTGWPADRMLQTLVHSVNGRRNTQLEHGFQFQPDPTYARSINMMRSFQLRDALVVKLNPVKSKVEEMAKPPNAPNAPKTVSKFEPSVTFLEERMPEDLQKEYRELKVALDLDVNTNTFKVVWGAISPNKHTIAMETRSVLQLMSVLSARVEVTDKEIEEGRVEHIKLRPEVDMSGLRPLMKIKSGENVPNDAFAACEYRGRWYWIPDTDPNSKRTFTYLTLLLTVAEADSQGGAQVLISTN